MRRPALLIVALTLALSACSVAEDTRVNVVFADNGPNARDTAFAMHSALAEDIGLVVFDANGQVSPALAQRWVVADDGLSYIFRIDDLVWSDGETVTARQIVVMLQDAIARARRNKVAIAPELASIDAIIARTEEVIEVQLRSPRPRLLDVLASPDLALARNGEGLGPFKSISAPKGRLFAPVNRVAEAETELRPQVYVRTLPMPQAVAAYRDSRIDMVGGLRYDAAPIIAAAGLPESEIRVDPTLGHFGLILRDTGGLLSDPAAREAVAMAIDRPRLVAAFGIDGWREMNSLSTRGLTARGDVPDPAWLRLNAQDRKRQAVTQLPPELAEGAGLSVFLPTKGPGADLLLAYLAADMADIGLTLTRAPILRDADMVLIDEVSDFDDPLWYLTRLSCARLDYCSAEADDLVGRARAAQTVAQRKLYLAEAEGRLIMQYGYIPIATPVRLSLVRPGTRGFAPNLRGLHPLHYLRVGS